VTPRAPSPDGASVATGRSVVVRVPATSANLGPGFDSFGLALGIVDELRVVSTAVAGVRITVSGEGVGKVPLDESHLVVRALRAGLDRAGAAQPGLDLSCVNAVPHGRGLGSSAAAVVGGLLAARGLLDDPGPLDDGTVLELATAFEGHPDNAAAALLGGFTVSWSESGAGAGAGPGSGSGGAEGARAVTVPLHPDVRAVVCVPEGELATATARAMLPVEVPHADAAFTAGRAGLLVHALAHRPDLLVTATEERLHQRQRSGAMPRTAALLAGLRAAGVAAVVSGAGPSVLVLGVGEDLPGRVRGVLAGDPSWRVLSPNVGTLGARLVTESARVG
jgi:homoserine kinase